MVYLTNDQFNRMMQHIANNSNAMERRIMAQIDDLKAAVANLTTDVNAKMDQLKAEVVSAVADLNTQIEGVTAEVNALDEQVKA